MTTKRTSRKKDNQFQPSPAMQDLIDTLERAVTYRESHAIAQTAYFREAHGKLGSAPLQSCGTACCIAGDITLRHAVDQGFIDRNSPGINPDDLWAFFAPHQVRNPWKYVQQLCNLSNFEAHLLFSTCTHYTVHAYMANLFREGYRLEGDWACGFIGSYLDFQPVRIARHEGGIVVACNDYETPKALMRFLDTLKVRIQEVEA
jgi:hypothetical protein